MKTLYHGTTAARWAEPEADGAPLYLVNSYSEAEHYATEAGEAEWDEDVHEEGGNMPKVIVLAFPMDEIKALAAAGAVQLEPDWGWVQSEEHEAKIAKEKFVTPGWEESMAKVGSIAVAGFQEDHKKLGSIVEGPVDEHTAGAQKKARRP